MFKAHSQIFTRSVQVSLGKSDRNKLQKFGREFFGFNYLNKYKWEIENGEKKMLPRAFLTIMWHFRPFRHETKNTLYKNLNPRNHLSSHVTLKKHNEKEIGKVEDFDL